MLKKGEKIEQMIISILHFTLSIEISLFFSYFKCVLGRHRPHSEQWRESCTNEIFTWFKLCRRLPCLTCLYSQQDQLWTFNPLFSVVSSQMWLLLLFLWLQDRKVIWIPTLKNCFNATFASRRVLPCKHVGQRHHHVCLACADWGDADEVKNWCEDKTSLRQGRFLLEKSSDI